MTNELANGLLRDRIARDLKPVRPLRSPAQRALALVPLGLALIVLIPSVWGWRGNFSLLAPAASWGLSALQSLAGLAIIAIAFREAVPGRELSSRAIALSIAGAVIVFVGITFITQAVLPNAESPDVVVRFMRECFVAAIWSSIVPLAAVSWFVARAFPTRPAIAGMLCGLGAGLMNDAGVRLYCWVDRPSHVIVSHGGAILCIAMGGSLAATFVERLRSLRS